MLSSLSLRLSAVQLDIALDRFDAGDIFFYGVDAHRVVELVDGLLEAQFEKLILQFKNAV